MRLIDADALKEMIPTTSVDMFENCRYCSLLSEEQVNELIDMTPTVNSWIPCSEQLPEEGLPVVITAQDADGRFVDISIRSDVNYWSGFGRINVLAWMPIPEAYKGGE